MDISGWVVKPLGPSTAEVTYLVQAELVPFFFPSGTGSFIVGAAASRQAGYDLAFHEKVD